MATIAASGPISFTDIQAVMGGSGPVSIQDYIQSAATGYAKGVPGIGDTNLNIADFQGKSKALVSGLQYRLFRKRYTFSSTTGSGSAGTGLYGGGGGAGGVTVTDHTTGLGPASSATVASGTFSGGAGSGFGAGGGGTGMIRARYIRFQYATTSGSARYMNLAGVKLYTSLAGSNIINSSMATSALDYHPAPFLPSYLVDNNDNTMYHAGGDPNPWVMVDLGSEQFIYKVELTNRIDCCRHRIGGLTLQLRNNSGTTIYTSDMCALPNGSTAYEGSGSHMDGYLYYNWWPAVNTTPYGSNSTPYAPPPLFTAGQGASGFAYIQPPTIGTGTITARYLTFEYGNANGGVGRYIQSSGVRVYSSLSGANIITSSMTVTASSVLSSGFAMAYLVDNIDSTTYISVDTEYPWVKVDLGSEQPIHRVELMNRYDGAKGRLVGIRMVLSNASNTIVHTSGMISDKNGAFVYQTNENAFMYYTFWPAITTVPTGSDTVPYPATEFFTNISTSYTFPIAGTARLLLMGGGGGGGSNAGTNSRGGGGGGAGYLQSYFIPVTSGTVATLTVGGPGTADVSGGTTSAVINSTTYTAAGGGNGNATQTGGAGSAAGGSGASAEQASRGGLPFMKARYVLFDYGNGNGGGGRYLHFMTVRVYSTPGGSNITTPSMTVSASSAAASASLIIDNDDTTLWHSGLEEYPWIMVDLGSEQFIHKVELMNRTDCCRGRIAGARLVLRNNSNTVIYTSNLMTLKNGSTTYQDWPGNDGFLYYNWWPAANTIAYGSDTTPYADIAMNQSGAPAIGHLTNDGGYFADDPTWFDSRTENYSAGLVTNFTNINTATGGIVPTDGSWDMYSVEWFGYFYATVTGTYTFYTASDDASYLWVGASALSGYTTSNSLINGGGAVERSGTISLTAGTYYPIRFQFGESTGGDVYNLSFSAPGITRTYNLAGYVYYGMGTYSSFPINHARLLRATNTTTVDRSYFVNVAGTATPTYCLMDSKWDGGGWMMMLKATAGVASLTATSSVTENTSTSQTSRYMGSIPLPAGFVNGSTISVTMTGTRGPGYGYIEGGSYIQDTTDTIRFIQLVYGNEGASGAATISGTATTSLTASMFPLKVYKYSAYPGWSVSAMTLNVTITYSNTTDGTVFPYSSTYWTDATTTLNTGSTNRTTADAKFAVMNRTPIKDVLALWPDVGTTGGSISQTEAWSWMINNYYYGGARVTPIVGFSSSNSRDATTHFLNTSDQTSFAGYSASIWSQQAGAKRHVMGGGTHLSANANVRWGMIWNNENDFATVDVTGGIGMSHGSYSAGDYYGGAGTSVLNRSMRVELYGR